MSERELAFFNACVATCGICCCVILLAGLGRLLGVL